MKNPASRNLSAPLSQRPRVSLQLRKATAPLAASIAVASCFLAPSANAQQAPIIFTPPASAARGGANTIGLTEITNNGTIATQDNARTSILSGTGTIVRGALNVLNISEGGAAGHFGAERSYFSDTLTGGDDINNISILYQGTVRIPTTGAYTFDINSDDGFTLAFDNGNSPFSAVFGDVNTVTDLNRTQLATYNTILNGAMAFPGGRGSADSFGQITLTAGDHPFTLTYHEGTGGANIEFSAATGAKTTFDSAFNLLGAPTFTVTQKLVTVGAWDYVRLNGDADGSNSLDEAITQYNNNLPAGNFVRSSQATINFQDPEGANTGGHSPVRSFPGDIVGTNEENFGGAGRAAFTLAAADTGRYTFLVYADDSTRFRILNSAGNPIAIVDALGGAGSTEVDTNGDTVLDAMRTTGCCADALAKYDLTTAGVYTLEAIFNEQGGGAGFFVYGAKGDFDSFTPTFAPTSFQLVGENLNTTTVTPAGLQVVVPEPSSALLGIAAGMGVLGLRRRRD